MLLSLYFFFNLIIDDGEDTLLNPVLLQLVFMYDVPFIGKYVKKCMYVQNLSAKYLLFYAHLAEVNEDYNNKNKKNLYFLLQITNVIK